MATCLETIDNPNGWTDCPGFSCAATACDIRGTDKERLDLALLSGSGKLTAAGVFTTNDVCAAPVHLCRELLAADNGRIGGIVVNSGNANACTGADGMEDARAMAEAAAKACDSNGSFLVCSTGRIGRRLPMAKILPGIRSAGDQLASEPKAGIAAANAILTSDTRAKMATVRIHHGDQVFTVCGFAKGAGMIEPNMATMLAFLATDFAVPVEILQSVVRQASNRTFNRISIDGDMSTNDTVLLVANGASGVAVDSDPALMEAFAAAVEKVCFVLADKIVADGEKITKVVELYVEGAPDEVAADKVARAIANSLLVKSSWYGSDPNWGRLLDAAGYARIGLIEDQVDCFYNDCPVLLAGVAQDQNLALWKQIVQGRRFSIRLNLNLGDASVRLLTTDLSEAYVNFNKSE
jgi:glutamate N-acetyltransferase/amino-acid N-acetyltransferase